MKIGGWLERLRPKTELEELTDLEGWRTYYFDLLLRLSLILMPLGLAVTIPSLLAERQYGIIACDAAGVVLLLATVQLVRSARLRGIITVFFFVALATVFFITLGPFYARPGWFVLGSVTAALLLGTWAAVAVTLFFSFLLAIVYLLIGPHLAAWVPVYEQPATTWVIFVINITLIALVAGLPVSLLLKRLNISFFREVDLRKRITAESDALKAANASLEREVGERRRAEEALRENEANLREAQKIARMGRWEYDLRSKRLRWSDTISQIFESNPVDLPVPYEAFLQTVHPEDREAVRSVYAEVTRNGEGRSVSHRLLMPDGRIKWVNGSCRAEMDTEGKTVRVRGVLQDITELKVMERQLFESQKMEAMGALAGGIAHDFNNILGSIIGYTELAVEQPDDDARRHCVEQVLNACDRAKNLVRQILAFSRRAEGERKPLDLGVIVKESLKLLASTIPATVAIQRHIVGQTHTVIADPTQMHQILMNLCTNAVHAMGEAGGTLTVRLTHEDCPPPAPPGFEEAPQGPCMMLIVSDTGPGIDPAIMDLIFDPFFTTKPKDVGTGLGLSVVYGIVKNHGGSVTVQNNPDTGAAFTVTIPCAVEAQPERERPETVPLEGSRGNERVLFVDDEKTLASVGERMLLSLGYNATVHTKSLEALQAFRSNPGGFDLVVTDMAMPGMTGKELAAQILSIRPDMPVILCTGYSEYINDESAARLGIRAFLMKPFSRKDLARVIRNTLDGAKAA